AEADETDALPRADAVTLVHEGDDPARDEAGDLNDRELRAVRFFDDQRAALVLLARLVERGVEEGAGHVDGARDLAGDGSARDVHVEDAEKGRNADPFRGPEAELGRRPDGLHR